MPTTTHTHALKGTMRYRST